MRVTYSSPVVLGRSFYVEYDSEAQPQQLLEWAQDEYDVLLWLWKFHLVWSLEGDLRYVKAKRVGEGGSPP